MAINGQPRSNPALGNSFDERPVRRLESWKEIASYLDRSEKTVRRWEESEGLPVHRLLHEKRGTVYAYARELEEWRRSRKPHNIPAPEPIHQDMRGKESDLAVPGTALPHGPDVGAPPLDQKDDTPEALPQKPTSGLSARGWSTVLCLFVSLFICGLIAARYGARMRDSILQETSPIRVHSLAVLPLEDLSGDAEQEYFANGMTAELITELARISSIRVISRTSVMRYKGNHKPLAQVARELNVDAVVEGELLRSHNRVRITVQLIDTAGDKQIWAEAYDRDLDDVLTLQGNIARSIADAIRIKLTPIELAHIAPGRRVDPKAYEAYLKARFFLEKRTADGMNKAVELFAEAIRKDSRYAEAYAGLAKTYQLLGSYEMLPPKDSFPKAREAADRALQLDDTLSEAYAARALSTSMYEHDWNAAEDDFQHAFRVNSNDAMAHHWYAEHLVTVGKVDRAIAELKVARELDPLSLTINGVLGRAYRDAGRFQESIDQCQKTLELDRDFPLTHYCLGVSNVATKHYAQAVQELKRADAVGAAPLYTGALGYAYAAAGDSTKAKAIIEALKRRTNRTYVPSYFIAEIYGRLGERDQAFDWLERGYVERDPQLSYLLVAPFMDPLRSDARYDRIVSKFGFPP